MEKISSVLKREIENHPNYSQYAEWKAKYPRVMEEFESLTKLLIAGKRRFGMELLVNKIRWEFWYNHDEDLKINNNYKSLITRELMIKFPEMRNLVQIRSVSEAGKQKTFRF